MAPTLQRFWGKFAITATSKDFVINDGSDHAIELTVGDYFIDGYTGEGTDQLCEHITDKIDDHVTGATCTISHTTGIVTLDWNGNSVSVTWTDTALRDLLGWTGDLGAATSHVAPNQAQHIWLPSRAVSTLPDNLTTWWSIRSTTKITRSKDGTTYSNIGNKLYDGVFGYETLSESEVISDSSTVHESLREFFEDVLHEGMPVRVFPDRTVNTSTDYITGHMIPPDASAQEGATIGSWEDWKNRTSDEYQGLWNFTFQMIKSVT
jgi:hypothetical protein